MVVTIAPEIFFEVSFKTNAFEPISKSFLSDTCYFYVRMMNIKN